MLVIRKALPGDVPHMLRLIRELAIYEREPQAVTATEEDLLRDGFGPSPRYFCLMADWDGAQVGFAFYFHTYSTWLGRWGLYLEDLFVEPQHRGKGIGRALLVELARIAVEKKCGRINWQVLDWNEPALKFYDKLGARRLSEWETYRLAGDALERLARAEEPALPATGGAQTRGAHNG
jgi:GNAT superfamily N-acetyltransferase